MFISYIRAVVLYLLLILAVRLMGKRQVGELEPAEFVVAMLLADLASVPMQDIGIPLLSGVIPIVTVLAVELILSVLAMRSRRVRRFLTGQPVVLMEDGRILQKNLERTRLTVEELVQHLREQGIWDLSTVRCALLEVDGQLSALVDPAAQPPSAKDLGVKTQPAEVPVTVVRDGVVLDDHLTAAGRDRTWLERQLASLDCRLSEVYLLTATPGGRLYLSRKGEKGCGR